MYQVGVSLSRGCICIKMVYLYQGGISESRWCICVKWVYLYQGVVSVSSRAAESDLLTRNLTCTH